MNTNIKIILAVLVTAIAVLLLTESDNPLEEAVNDAGRSVEDAAEEVGG